MAPDGRADALTRMEGLVLARRAISIICATSAFDGTSTPIVSRPWSRFLVSMLTGDAMFCATSPRRIASPMIDFGEARIFRAIGREDRFQQLVPEGLHHWGRQPRQLHGADQRQNEAIDVIAVLPQCRALQSFRLAVLQP